MSTTITFSPSPPAAQDFWRSGAGATTLPDGTTDLTEAIRRNGWIGINRDPLSQVDTGSIGMAYLLVGNGQVVNLTDTHHTLALNGAGVSATAIFPAANTCAGREYCIKINDPTNQRTASTFAVQSLGGTIEGPPGVQTAVGGTFTVNQANGRGCVWRSDGVNWHLIQYGVYVIDWHITGNDSTTPTAYADSAGQTNNFLGTTDNQPISIYTNAADSNAKSDLKLYPVTAMPAIIAAAANILHIRRNGINAVSYPGVASFAIGKWLAGIQSRTRLDINLGNGNTVTPDFTPISLFSQGGVGINGSGATADWTWAAAGGIGRGGNGGALLALMGANGSLNVGPHIGVWTAADAFPLYYHLNYSHDNIAMLFDGYYDGAWRYSHTTRPYAVYKLADRLNFYGSAAAGVAGTVWTQDLMMAMRYAGATMAGGELWFNNVVKNRRIVLHDANATSDHQFYGFGINASTLRYQVAGTTDAHRFYAATAAATSQSLVDIRGDRIIDSQSAIVVRSVVLTNFAANAVIGTSAATVNITNTIIIPQTTAGITLTLPNPTYAQAGRPLWISNTGTVSVTVGGQGIAAGRHLPFVWSGAAWVPLTAPTAVMGSIDAHTDVDTTTTAPVVGQVLVWNGTNWVPGAGTAAPDIQQVTTATSTTIGSPLPIVNTAGYAPTNMAYTNPSAIRSAKLKITFDFGEMRIRMPTEAGNYAMRGNCRVNGVVVNQPGDHDRRWSTRVNALAGGTLETTTGTKSFVHVMTLTPGATVNLQMDYDLDVNTAYSAGNNARVLCEPSTITVESWLI